MNGSLRTEAAVHGRVLRRLVAAAALGLAPAAGLVLAAHANAGPPTYRDGAISA